MTEPLMEVTRLGVTAGGTRLVEDLDLTVHRGERLALVGESGSGKSVTARALMRLDPGLRLSGSVRFAGEELLAKSEAEMRRVRRDSMGMVFQDPLGSLDPLMTVGEQVAEPLRLGGLSKKAARVRAVEVLDELGVANAATRAGGYPHEFSGGMRQRVVIGIALAAEPELLIADEPTTALDVRVQEQVLTLLDRVSRERGLTVLLITHDLGIVAGFADRVAVMYAGRKVHDDPVGATFAGPAHPYTAGLLTAVPRIDRRPRRLTTIPGAPPHPRHRPAAACAFAPRCPHRKEVCGVEIPPARPTTAGGSVACHVYGTEVFA
ncbi:ABC transporter ATP-binding protein [Pseudonocardia sp. WMMC193]|uniref:ABC transporter ATP-binding protein n=1 Tax=Pseudonocardia sp. WMMC193 TaxID=2911965 RepID=UPI001F3E6DBA|nr:ABC transporter ATP-binding protein [Pseudonocardia sp. WMMC193]MCF7552732.1 ABC transporter ATP-binding protein [Pseudonocardia sp. WMMC193]